MVIKIIFGIIAVILSSGCASIVYPELTVKPGDSRKLVMEWINQHRYRKTFFGASWDYGVSAELAFRGVTPYSRLEEWNLPRPHNYQMVFAYDKEEILVNYYLRAGRILPLTNVPEYLDYIKYLEVIKQQK